MTASRRRSLLTTLSSLYDDDGRTYLVWVDVVARGAQPGRDVCSVPLPYNVDIGIYMFGWLLVLK